MRVVSEKISRGFLDADDVYLKFRKLMAEISQ